MEWNHNSSIEFGMVSNGEQLALNYICARTLLQLALLFTFQFICSFHTSLNQTHQPRPSYTLWYFLVELTALARRNASIPNASHGQSIMSSIPPRKLLSFQ